MLSYDALLEEANLRGMPKQKIRGIVREYLQLLMLKYLYASKYQEHFCFMGGTCLRFLYDLKRFSEDLDFNVKELSKNEFEESVLHVKAGLEKEGMACENEFYFRKNLFTAEFIFKNVLNFYKAGDKRGNLVVKFETNAPSYSFPVENHTVSGYGEIFFVKSLPADWIFADKIDTLKNKRLGRHVYDILFLLSKKFSISSKLLQIHGIKKRSPYEALLEILNAIPDGELRKMSQQVAPFLFDEAERSWIERAKTIARDLIEKQK